MTMKNNYPTDDQQFNDTTIVKVEASDAHWAITQSDGWSLLVPNDSPITPEEGMALRLYGKGLGGTIRGVFIDGVQVYYRTEAEEEDYREIQMYGADATEWLSRWDAGETVWSVEMGGFGPAYEQALQVTAAEMVRELLTPTFADRITAADRAETYDALSTRMHESKRLDGLGLSGSQFGAAFHPAYSLVESGPRSVMKMDGLKDRHILVNNRPFPSINVDAPEAAQ